MGVGFGPPGPTVTVTAPETDDGPGFATVMLALPGADAFPVAVSCDEETKLVVNAAPFHCTCAPLINRLPVTVNEKWPGWS